ncbi:hypothetical protein [Streptomyces sp. NPDC018693]|uniref:hypothetical protein n=1 Tax=unclassified Streptomyces TaxID=2593676 RepID=UPI003798CE82
MESLDVLVETFGDGAPVAAAILLADQDREDERVSSHAEAVKARRYDDPARAAGKAAKLITAREKAGYREVAPDAGRPDTERPDAP